MRKFKKNYFLIGLLVSFGMTQHFNLNVEPTGQFQLVIFEESISFLEENDEIGIFDSNGVIESCYPDEGCADPLIGEVLVGTGRWVNSQLSISSVMSLDLSDFGGPTLNGAVNIGDASADAIAIAGTATFTPSADFDGGFTVASSQTIDMGGNQITNVADPTQAQNAATKAYVDAVKTGLNVKDSAKLATTAALAASTYANGSSGVGATLTANANGALSIDLSLIHI